MDQPKIPPAQEAYAALKTLRLWASEFFITEGCVPHQHRESGCASCDILTAFKEMSDELEAQLGVTTPPTEIKLTYADLGADAENVSDEDIEETVHLPEWAAWKGEGAEPASWQATNPETGEDTRVFRSYQDYCNN